MGIPSDQTIHIHNECYESMKKEVFSFPLFFMPITTKELIN